MTSDINNKIHQAIFNFHLEAEKETIEGCLKENIKSLGEYEKKKKKLLFLAKATAKKKHNEYLLELAEKFHEAVLRNTEKPVAILKQLIQGNEQSLALYRNLDKLSKEDIIEIIKDKNLLDLLETLDNGKKDQ